MPEDHQLEIMEALPTAWENGVLTLSIGGQSRPMNVNQVQAIAVGGIVAPGQAPYVIVDLMLDVDVEQKGRASGRAAVQYGLRPFSPGSRTGSDE